MDLNLTVLCGTLTTAPDIQHHNNEQRTLKLLITVRSDTPSRRVDVIPVILHNPDNKLIETLTHPGQRIWIVGTIQRRFTGTQQGRKSRLGIIAHTITVDSVAVAPSDVM